MEWYYDILFQAMGMFRRMIFRKSDRQDRINHEMHHYFSKEENPCHIHHFYKNGEKTVLKEF